MKIVSFLTTIILSYNAYSACSNCNQSFVASSNLTVVGTAQQTSSVDLATQSIPSFTFQFKNNTSSPKDIQSIQGTDSGSFIFSVNRCTNVSPGKTCQITITSKTKKLAPKTYSATINDAAIQLTVADSTTQTQGTSQYGFEPSNLSNIAFSSGERSKTITITVKNSGNGSGIPQLSIQNASSLFFLINRCENVSLGAGKSCSIILTAKAPPNGQPISDSLILKENNIVKTSLPVAVAPPPSQNLTCTFNGQTYQNGASIPGFSANSVSFGSQCSSVAVSGTCQNGSITNAPAYSSCSVQVAASCTFNGQTIASGTSVQAFASGSVSFGASCVSEQRTCNNGVLSGTNTFAACSVGQASSCSFNGQTYNHGDSVPGFSSNSVAFGNSCSSVSTSGLCQNGSITNQPAFATCSVQAAASCTFNGQTFSHGSSVPGFSSSSVAFGDSCSNVAVSGTCQNGSITNQPTSATCSVQAAASCTFNGQPVSSSSSILAYQSSNVAYGSSCVSEQRTCNNGVLSGSNTFESCSVSAPASCTLDGQTIAHGASINAYSTRTASVCTAEVRTCDNGTLSGVVNAQYSSCQVVIPQNYGLSFYQFVEFSPGTSLVTSPGTCVAYGIDPYNGCSGSPFSPQNVDLGWGTQYVCASKSYIDGNSCYDAVVSSGGYNFDFFQGTESYVENSTTFTKTAYQNKIFMTTTSGGSTNRNMSVATSSGWSSIDFFTTSDNNYPMIKDQAPVVKVGTNYFTIGQLGNCTSNCSALLKIGSGATSIFSAHDITDLFTANGYLFIISKNTTDTYYKFKKIDPNSGAVLSTSSLTLSTSSSSNFRLVDMSGSIFVVQNEIFVKGNLSSNYSSQGSEIFKLDQSTLGLSLMFDLSPGSASTYPFANSNSNNKNNENFIELSDGSIVSLVSVNTNSSVLYRFTSTTATPLSFYTFSNTGVNMNFKFTELSPNKILILSSYNSHIGIYDFNQSASSQNTYSYTLLNDNDSFLPSPFIQSFRQSLSIFGSGAYSYIDSNSNFVQGCYSMGAAQNINIGSPVKYNDFVYFAISFDSNDQTGNCGSNKFRFVFVGKLNLTTNQLTIVDKSSSVMHSSDISISTTVNLELMRKGSDVVLFGQYDYSSYMSQTPQKIVFNRSINSSDQITTHDSVLSSSQISDLNNALFFGIYRFSPRLDTEPFINLFNTTNPQYGQELYQVRF